MKYMYSVHPEHFKKMNSDELIENFLCNELFIKDQINMSYTYEDRNIIGGVFPIEEELELPNLEEFKAEYFLENREIGIINIGELGKIIVDGVEYPMKKYDGIYIPQGVKSVKFINVSGAKFYFNSGTAHKAYEIKHVSFAQSQPVKLGEAETLNKRTIYQYFHPDVCDTCQLLMGMTVLEEGSCWNTFPPHIHERRMEAYFYFDMDEKTRVFKMIGKPDETRHVILKNEQAIISPVWSIHSGVGTGKYSFIWGMVGENKTFTDMDSVEIFDMK